VAATREKVGKGKGWKWRSWRKRSWAVHEGVAIIIY